MFTCMWCVCVCARVRVHVRSCVRVCCVDLLKRVCVCVCVCVGEFGSSVVTMKRPLLTPFMLSGSLSITFAAVRLSSALEQRQCYKDSINYDIVTCSVLPLNLVGRAILTSVTIITLLKALIDIEVKALDCVLLVTQFVVLPPAHGYTVYRLTMLVLVYQMFNLSQVIRSVLALSVSVVSGYLFASARCVSVHTVHNLAIRPSATTR